MTTEQVLLAVLGWLFANLGMIFIFKPMQEYRENRAKALAIALMYKNYFNPELLRSKKDKVHLATAFNALRGAANAFYSSYNGILFSRPLSALKILDSPAQTLTAYRTLLRLSNLLSETDIEKVKNKSTDAYLDLEIFFRVSILPS